MCAALPAFVIPLGPEQRGRRPRGGRRAWHEEKPFEGVISIDGVLDCPEFDAIDDALHPVNVEANGENGIKTGEQEDKMVDDGEPVEDLEE
ncbi:hypothetical protein Rt10032_c16g5772 [Rhodotorula toruloides]|uniref:Uncharacterized protein n=1 Tax=Rhodotorula toruloides TaxID=5286 RepID=A0A511KP88_RHOTO|nr:hypothetical protein Rt10032_c16g5772 [Rhodotorula toruloides]